MAISFPGHRLTLRCQRTVAKPKMKVDTMVAYCRMFITPIVVGSGKCAYYDRQDGEGGRQMRDNRQVDRRERVERQRG